MRKQRPKKADSKEFTFLDSLKITPDHSNNISFLNAYSTNSKTFGNQSISLLRESNFPQLFSCGNKENIQLKFSLNDLSTNVENSFLKSKIKKSKISLKEKESPFNIKIDLSSSIPKNNLQKGQNTKIIKNPSLKSISSSSKKSPQKKQQNIKVYIRLKPKRVKQSDNGLINVLNSQTIKIEDNYYSYDEIFNTQATQFQIFDHVGKQLCNKLFEGYNGTIFAYGQTGSGKTYTIFGQDSNGNQGLILRSINYILNRIQKSNLKVKVSCTMVELYKEELIDMFDNERELKLKESKSNGVYIQGLKEIQVTSEAEMLSLVKIASKSRKVTSTKINQQSSRSHTILSIYLYMGSTISKLCLIDLAGSENARKSDTKGEAFEQTKKINYSLSCLGNVINALTTRNKCQHIPFRDSKLTRILKDSLTGHFLTSIIVNCSTLQNSLSETISSLKFAERAKKVKVNLQNLEEERGEKESILHLHSIIKKLKQDLQVTTNQLKKYKESKTQQSLKQEIIPQEAEMSAINPIPSERANVQQNIKKYMYESKGKPQILEINLQQFSSLNVSKSIHKMGEQSPQVSSLSYKYDDSPDLSLSFSIHGESARRNLFH